MGVAASTKTVKW